MIEMYHFSVHVDTSGLLEPRKWLIIIQRYSQWSRLAIHGYRVECRTLRVEWHSKLAPIWKSRECLVIGERSRLNWGHIRHPHPELAFDDRRGIDDVLPLTRQSLHFGEDVRRRHKGDDVLKELGSVEYSFAGGICGHAAGVASRSGSGGASNFASLLARSVLKALRR